MSLPTATRQNKLQRYLQRIQKLVGNRSKSPLNSLTRSRISQTKSTISIHTNKIDRYLEYQKSIKFLFKAINNYNQNCFKYFISKISLFNSTRQIIFCQEQKQHKSIKIDTLKQKALQTIHQYIKFHIKKSLLFSFNNIKASSRQNIVNSDQNYDFIKRQNSNILIKNYSRIYLQTFSTSSNKKYYQKSRSISPFIQYESRTPQKFGKQLKIKDIKNHNHNHKKLQIKFIKNILLSINSKLFKEVFTKIKIYYITQQIHNKLQIKYQNKNNKNKNKINSVYKIFNTINKKITMDLCITLYKIKQNQNQKIKKQSKLHQLQSKIIIIKTILMYKLRIQLKNVFDKIKIQSISSANKHQPFEDELRTTNPRTVNFSEDFDNFAQKINKAFQLKFTLNKIYSYVFVKTFKSASLSFTLSNPFNKIFYRNLKESFKRINLYKIQKQKCSLNHLHLQNKCQEIFNSNKFNKSVKRMSDCLKKLDKKIIFSKIDAYSELKLYYPTKSKQFQNNQNSFLTQKTLKRQLSQFLSQRDKIREKTLTSWIRTKQILDQPIILQSRVK